MGSKRLVSILRLLVRRPNRGSAAAIGLVMMAGATTLTGVTQDPAPAMFPLAVGSLLAMVAAARRPKTSTVHTTR